MVGPLESPQAVAAVGSEGRGRDVKRTVGRNVRWGWEGRRSRSSEGFSHFELCPEVVGSQGPVSPVRGQGSGGQGVVSDLELCPEVVGSQCPVSPERGAGVRGTGGSL